MSERSGTARGGVSGSRNPRQRRLRLPHVLIITAVLLGAASLHKDRFAAPAAARPRSSAAWARVFSALPLSFELNQGQTDRQAKDAGV